MKKFLKSLFGSMLMVGLSMSWGSGSWAEPRPDLVILPFFVQRIENPARGAVICPLCKGIYEYGEVVPGAPSVLTKILYAKMEALERFRVLPLEKTEEVLTPAMKEQFEQKPIPSVIRIGKELGTDFVLAAFLFRYQERVGSAIGVEKPASVALDVHLFRLRDGLEVWRGKFDETQKSLSENLLKMGSFFRRKASWLRAEELASVGMDEMLKQLPEVRELEEKRP